MNRRNMARANRKQLAWARSGWRHVFCWIWLVGAGPLFGQKPVQGLGTYEATLDGLASPMDVVVLNDGRLAISNPGEGKVVLAKTDGSSRAAIEGLLAPAGLWAEAEELWLCDAGSHEVRSFGLDGKPKRRWGQLGSALGELFQPAALALSKGRVYVVDRGNDRIQVFLQDGTSVGQLVPPPDRPLLQPNDLVFDEQGALYVADTGNHRVVKYGADGGFERSWGEWGAFPGFLDTPSSLLWWKGTLFVVDTRNHRVQAFDGQGRFVGLWGTHELRPHEGKGRLHYPDALAFDEAGKAYIVEALEDRIQIFDRSREAAQPDLTAPANKRTHFGMQLSVDNTLMAVAEPEAHYVFLYDLRKDVPINIHNFGERGEGFGLMMDTAAVWLDLSKRRVRTSDLALERIQEFELLEDPLGELKYRPNLSAFVEALETKRLASNMPKRVWPLRVVDMAQDAQGLLYLLDSANAEIHVFQENWGYLRSFGGRGTGKGQFLMPSDFVCKEGRVWVVDRLARKVTVFNDKGKVQREIKPESGAGQLKEPYGVAIDEEGSVYVSDRGSDRIVVFSRKGRFKHAWGQRGMKMGDLWYPAGLAFDGQGRLIVVDHGNHRLQIFDRDGTWRVTLGAGRAFTWKNPPRQVPEGGNP